jgi:hypothetical protein
MWLKTCIHWLKKNALGPYDPEDLAVLVQIYVHPFNTVLNWTISLDSIKHTVVKGKG